MNESPATISPWSRAVVALTLALGGALGGLAALAPAACTSSSSTQDGGVIQTDLGTCPTAAWDASFGKFPSAAVPGGQPCTSGTVCHLPVDTCPSDFTAPNGGTNLTEYECFCQAARWSCSAAEVIDTSCEEGGSFVPPPADAGTDAPDDAAPDGASNP
jgi:hypothetical protein